MCGLDFLCSSISRFGDSVIVFVPCFARVERLHLKKYLSCQGSITVVNYLFPSRYVVGVQVRENCISHIPCLVVGGMIEALIYGSCTLPRKS